jgi:hypothetical protein
MTQLRRGDIRLGVIDDLGSVAPVIALIKAIAEFGICITIEETRLAKAGAKWNDIHALFLMHQAANRC